MLQSGAVFQQTCPCAAGQKGLLGGPYGTQEVRRKTGATPGNQEKSAIQGKYPMIMWLGLSNRTQAFILSNPYSSLC
jgi:hypothetical protein